jgi:methionyl-tRNA formyltransferase
VRIVIAGTRTFGLQAYETLQGAGHKVAGVIAPFNDKLGIVADLDGAYWHHEGTGVPLSQWVAAREADLIVAAHSHAFLGRRTRAATRLGALGYHPSLLPRHRGRDAVRWTVAMRDPIAGGTAYWFDDNVDGGPIAAQSWCHVDPAWTAHDLWRERLFPIGIELLTRVLADLDEGVLVSEPQDQRFATWEYPMEYDLDYAEVQWLAGLLEGEGYFGMKPAREPGPHRPNGEPPRPTIRLEMTDLDVVQRVATRFFNDNAVNAIDRRESRPNSSVTYKTGVSGERAIEIMRRIRPFLGSRRGATVDALIEAFPPKYRAPLFRPELPELGGPAGFEVRGRVER